MAICGGDGGFGFLPADEARIKSRDDWTIWCEIQAIQNAILNSIASCGYSAVVNDNSPMTSIDGIVGIDVVDGGQGYEPVYATVSFTHPNGFGATAEVEHVNGIIQAINITNGGSSYEPIVATCDMTNSGDGNAFLTPVVESGAVTSVVVYNGASGYSVGEAVSVVHQFGIGASATIADVDANGSILRVDVINGGVGYDTIGATCEVTHPFGTGFDSIVHVLEGQIAVVEVMNSGRFYNDLIPTVSVIDETGSGFVGTVDTELGVVTNIDVIDGGYGYSADATAVVSLGTGAVLTVDLGDSGECKPCATGHCPTYTPQDYFLVYSDSEENRVISEQMKTVVTYFTKLGYTIRATTNPETGATIQWNVSW